MVTHLQSLFKCELLNKTTQESGVTVAQVNIAHMETFTIPSLLFKVFQSLEKYIELLPESAEFNEVCNQTLFLTILLL